ncbi:MAG: hypothetical protein ABJL67_12935 [Sulfitobacter sp.]
MIPKINFSTIDLYFLDRVPYHFIMGDDHSAYFRREDGTKAIERFGWEELDHIVGSERWECKRRQATIQDAQIARDPYVFIWELTKKQRKLLLFRWFFVCAVNKLREEQNLSLTTKDVAEKYLLIQLKLRRSGGHSAENSASNIIAQRIQVLAQRQVPPQFSSGGAK